MGILLKVFQKLLKICKKKFCHVNDFSVYLSRWEGKEVLQLNNELESFFLVCWSVESPDISKVKNLLLIFQDKKCMHKIHSFRYVLRNPGICTILEVDQRRL